MEIFKDFPDRNVLMQEAAVAHAVDAVSVNAHIHTPFSFSSFEAIADAFRLAASEGVRVLGVNDFYTAAGYDEFLELAAANDIFPLLNMEFICLSEDERKRGIRINDPNNPGRMYICGKGFRYPFTLSENFASTLENVRGANRSRIAAMVEKLNGMLEEIGAPFTLSLEEMERTIAKESVRERHLAKAVALAMDSAYAADEEKREFLARLYGRESKADLQDRAELENEIRGNILKSGGRAFVEEDPSAFLDLSEVKALILDGGAIPCYPVLLDDAKGNRTEFEADAEALADNLIGKGIFAIELIPARNSAEALFPFVKFFHERGFVVLFGTEHNSPGVIPLTVSCRNGVALDGEMRRINYEGACVIAAHQYLVSRGERGYVDADGQVDRGLRGEFVRLGDGVIRHYLGKFASKGQDR